MSLFNRCDQSAQKMLHAYFTRATTFSLCTLLMSCGTLSQIERDASDVETQRFASTGNLQAEVDSLVQPLIQSGEAPGITVGVLLPNGSMQFFGYGVTDQSKDKRPNGDTLFATGSLSKGFLGDLTAVLVDEGVLSWNDTLDKLLPPHAPLSVDAKKITLLQLATHTSGLPLQPVTFQTFRYFVQYLFTGENFYRHLDSDYVFNYLGDFKAPAKLNCQYSNLGYGILGYVLQRKTGQTLDALLVQKLLHPLGLKNTGYVPDSLPGHENRAHGHVGDQPKFKWRGERMADWQFPELMKGSAGVYSSARDLLTLASAHLNGNGARLNVALADTLKVRLQKPTDAPAIAWFVDNIDGQSITYQVGMVSGFASYLGMDVERRTAVVVLQNSFYWTDKVGQKLLLRMTRAHLRQAPPTHAILGGAPEKTAWLKK